KYVPLNRVSHLLFGNGLAFLFGRATDHSTVAYGDDTTSSDESLLKCPTSVSCLYIALTSRARSENGHVCIDVSALATSLRSALRKRLYTFVRRFPTSLY